MEPTNTAAASSETIRVAGLNLPSHWPAQTDLMQWCLTMNAGTAAILVLIGLVYLLFGVYIYRGLVVFNAAVMGAFFGAIIGDKSGSAVAGALLGAFMCGAIAWPLMKYAVVVMGGVYGAVLGAAIWRTCGLEPQFAWAGGLSGLIFFGMLSFILFRGSIMMYMSLQGSVMVIFGLLGLIYKYQSVAPSLSQQMTLKPFLLPIAILIPTVLGVLYQQSQYKQPVGATDAAKKK